MQERGSPAGTNYSMEGISESNWKKVPQSGKSTATNYSLEGVKEEDWKKATGVTEADPISPFTSTADSAGQYSLREVTEED